MSLGKFIVKRRKCLHMTQEQLADKIHVSKSAIAKWETDGGIPDRDNLYRLAEIFGISVNDLHNIINGMEVDEKGYVNITSEVVAILESHGYKVIRPGEKE